MSVIQYLQINQLIKAWWAVPSHRQVYFNYKGSRVLLQRHLSCSEIPVFNAYRVGQDETPFLGTISILSHNLGRSSEHHR